jgi:hypothetical protein
MKLSAELLHNGDGGSTKQFTISSRDRVGLSSTYPFIANSFLFDVTLKSLPKNYYIQMQCKKDKQKLLPTDKQDAQRMGRQPHCTACHANDGLELHNGGHL